GMVLAVSKALESGASGIICASTGNTSASAAAYAAKAKIKCHVVLPAGKVAQGKLAQALIYGANVLAIHGNFDVALGMTRKLANDLGLNIVNSVNPYRLWGQRSGAWEVCDEIGAPDWCVLPVGNAGNISAYWAGFVQYRRAGLIASIPRMIGIQAQGAAPLVVGRPFEKPETVATAIRIGSPVNAKKAMAAVKSSKGMFLAVSDEEILMAQKDLASSEGIFAEPASCATLAGLYKLSKQDNLPKNARVVMVLTGSGLKDPEIVDRMALSPNEVAAEYETLREEILSC
ncbi:MAG: threonine synthase, partial [Acetomicrobium sp.]